MVGWTLRTRRYLVLLAISGRTLPRHHETDSKTEVAKYFWS
jgi:hypothetical protein